LICWIFLTSFFPAPNFKNQPKNSACDSGMNQPEESVAGGGIEQEQNLIGAVGAENARLCFQSESSYFYGGRACGSLWRINPIT
jgi:hypothetical protein